MKLSLYLDEDAMARSLVAGLRARGADVQTVVEAGLCGKADEIQRQLALFGGCSPSVKRTSPLESGKRPRWERTLTWPLVLTTGDWRLRFLLPA